MPGCAKLPNLSLSLLIDVWGRIDDVGMAINAMDILSAIIGSPIIETI